MYQRIIQSLFWIGCLAGSCANLVAEPGRDARAIITESRAVRGMSISEASAARPVRVMGIVTWTHADRVESGFIMQDKTAGIFVRLDGQPGREAALREMHVSLAAGDLIEVTGVTGAGGYAPLVLAREIRKTGRGKLPGVHDLGIGNLLAGSYDAQRVQVKGVVTECQPVHGGKVWSMVLAGTSGKARVVTPVMPGLTPDQVEDAIVLVSGVVFTRTNSKMELVGVSVETNDAGDVSILTPGGSDPFGVHYLEAGRLRGYERSGFSQRRRRISGVVTLSQPGVLYLQGPVGGSRVATRTRDQLYVPGDEVEAAGFVELFLGVPEMTGAVTRKLGSGKPLAPQDLTPDSLAGGADNVPVMESGRAEDADKLDRYSGVLVRVRGVLLETHQLPDGVELLVSCSGKPIRALLGTRDLGQWVPRVGSEISLTGVAELTYDLSPWLPNRSAVTDIRLLLRRPGDIVLHHEPPWWTTRRLLMALGTTFAVALVLGASAVLLVRRVRAQAHAMAIEALAHQQVAAAHGAMIDERARLAGEMHDGLQPMLSGLAFYLEAVDASMPGPIPDAVAEPLGRARSLMARVRDEFRQCIWCLYDMGRQTGDLENELRRLARVQHQWRRAEVQTEISGTPVPLPPGLARALLLASQEAVENACRHGMAEHVTIHCRFHDDGLELEIADDGTGFDPAAAIDAPGIHTGLVGMRQRIERLGGTLDVTSSPGAGTSLLIRLASGSIEKIRNNPLAMAAGSPAMDAQNP